MKYFVIEGILKKNEPINDNLMKEHINYTQKVIEEGKILTSGLKEDMSGGLFIMKAQSINDIDMYLENEPFNLAGIQEYKVTEFLPHYINEDVNWFEK